MRVNKKILLLFLLLIPAFVFTANIRTVYADNTYKLVIEDDANLLSEEEENNLKEIMEPATSYGNIIFKSINHNNTTTENYARDYYHHNFGTQSGTLFLIDMDKRNIYVFSDGKNHDAITVNKANIITDNIYTFASKADYYTCAKKAFGQINTILAGGKIAEPMKYISNVIVSLITAALVGFLITFFGYRVKKSGNKEIINNSLYSINVNSISGLKTGTHSVYNPPSSSSSGGSSGGGGGGSSGGGGGHSF